jgi:hypothetical protein
MAQMVIIEHPKTGEQYAIARANFTKKLGQEQSYEEQGFKMLRYEDGSPIEPAKQAKPRATKPAPAPTEEQK